jgi:electron transport complex protein RnfA
MNLLLQCALGIKGVCESKNPGRLTNLIRTGIIFIASILIWILFSRIISSIIHGIFIYVLLFPVTSLVYNGLEHVVFKILLKHENDNDFSISFPEGITAAAVFICMNIANSFLETLTLSFGFAFGAYLVFIILGEIRRRAVLEAVPQFLRGKPLVLISMGMLSLVFSVSSLLLFRMIGIR